MSVHKTPMALVLAGLDPTGGAGITADVMALSALGVHPLTVITANTVQTTSRCLAWESVTPQLIADQLDTALSHIQPDVIKIGMVGAIETAQLLADRLPDCPLVFDPVLASEKKDGLSETNLAEVLIETLLPKALITTPNRSEAQQLGLLGQRPSLQGAEDRYVLITGTASAEQANQNEIEHTLYVANQLSSPHVCWRQRRLEGVYHGSGCTLSSAIAAYVARGESVERAIERGLVYAEHSIAKAYGVDHGNGDDDVKIPNRMFGCVEEPLSVKRV